MADFEQKSKYYAFLRIPTMLLKLQMGRNRLERLNLAIGILNIGELPQLSF